MNFDNQPLILCSNNRLALALREAHGRAQVARGLQVWAPLPAMTLSQWLDGVLEAALLLGEIPPDLAPALVLDGLQERLLWRQVIEKSLDDNALAPLFDVGGMADVATEANRLLLAWNVAFPADAEMTEETRQFGLWREQFRRQCKQAGWLEAVRAFDWQIEHLARGAGRLPERLFIAGFDRISPQEQRLFDVLAARGTRVENWPHLSQSPAEAVAVGLADADAECRAAVAWCQRQLAADPAARIALVVPELGVLREKLVGLLDDVLHPESLAPERAGMPRCYDFSLGLPLSEAPPVAMALRLIRLSLQSRRVAQQEVSDLLLAPYWSADMSEADARARLDVALRAALPPAFGLDRLLAFVRRQSERGISLPQLQAHLDAMLRLQENLPRRQLPSIWFSAWQGLLAELHWPGERSLSSHEYQAIQAWHRLLAQMADLDAVLGPVSAAEAARCLSQACRERIFQPQSTGTGQIQVIGMLESVAEPLSALWVMGMNDHIWPPPARPNPLLPANAQRNAAAPNADSRVQAQFAAAVQRRLLHSAREVVFSYAAMEGERALRPSPLLAGMSAAPAGLVLAQTLAERLAAPGEMEWLEDHVAPPVLPGEKVRGGTGLLKAQAVCPAWAYYRYRLGARPLEEPVDGLDAMGRGELLHAAMEHFWQGRDSAWLHAQSDTDLQTAIASAVAQGLDDFNAACDAPLPPRFLQLEQQRLQRLLAVWLPLEKKRPPFAVESCEAHQQIDLGGIMVDLTLDRLDRLPDGKLVVIDYKTGGSVSHKSWADARISEPQLPVYAAMAMAGSEVAAVCFAKVRIDEQRFIGITAEADLLPGVDPLEAARKLFDATRFPDWAALMLHWQASIGAIVAEIRSGEAAVRFSDENDLRDCGVKPLLRLAERQLQRERAAGSSEPIARAG